MLALFDCGVEPCLKASFAFFKVVAVIAMAWAAFLSWVLVTGRRPYDARTAAALWSLPVVGPVVLLLQTDISQDANVWGAFVGWLWGLSFATYVRRTLRPLRPVDAPISSPWTPWDFAQLAFGSAIAAPLLGPILAGVLAAPFD